MKRTIYYILTFLTLSTLVIIIIDQLIMPYYIRHEKGKYMVNVVGKDFEYSDKILKSEGYKTSYVMIPRLVIKFLEYDIGLMADWIERTGYGADMNKLKIIQNELEITPTSLSDWLNTKLENQKKQSNSWTSQWKTYQWKLQWDK